MRLVIQRVTSSSVSVEGDVVGKIEKGLLILVGVGENDSREDATNLAEKVSKMRILADENDKMNLSVLDKKQKVLAISQFTLIADTKKGNRPSFIKAARPDKAKELYELFTRFLEDRGVEVEKGQFGEYMVIEAVLDGPVTIYLDSRE